MDATLLIGPEGGFNEAEYQQALKAGFKGLTLGPRILRTETAVVSALSLLQALYGDL
jgi:16S rRNA (uracil1498-N3)-methyltransferase